MIRLVLGPQDLRRIRIAAAPDPLAETMMAAALLRQRPASPIFGAWQGGLRGQFDVRARPLAAFIPAGLPEVDVSSLAGPADTVAGGVEAFLAAPSQDVLAEMRWTSQYRTPLREPWTRLDTDLKLRRELGDAICVFHATAIAPHWPRIRAFLQAERARQVLRVAAAGIDDLLAALCPPMVRWDPPVLEVWNSTDSVRDWDLGGRGLLIEPSVFLNPHPHVVFDPALPDAAPTLVYPAVRDLSTAKQLWAGARERQSLAALVGRTRSSALESIGDGCGTTELARRIGTSPAAASQHASVLRRSGLITTLRSGGTVLHSLTPLGRSLLNGDD